MSRTVIAALALICAIASARTQDFSAEDLARRTIERRAVEAVNWGMPAVNFDLMLQAMIGSAKGKPNQIVYWSRLPDWKNQTLTPNPEVIYLMPFFHTKDAGPLVLEIPPADEGSITGAIMDAWQAALEDVPAVRFPCGGKCGRSFEVKNRPRANPVGGLGEVTGTRWRRWMPDTGRDDLALVLR